MSSFGQDRNNLGASQYARGSVQIPEAYFNGIIEDILINSKSTKNINYLPDGSNVGEAKVRIVPDDWGVPIGKLNSAYPLETNIQNYPLVGEVVILFKAFGTLFYTRALGNRNSVAENLAKSFQTFFAERNNENFIDARNLASVGVPQNEISTLDENDDLSSNFFRYSINSSEVRQVSSSIGDIIFQGRFNNVVRLGSNLLNNPSAASPKPNILLTAGFYNTPTSTTTEVISPFSLIKENINKDRSSIWLVSEEEVPFLASTAKNKALSHLISSPNKTVKYDGAQIFINSDRVILNSKVNEISLFSNTEINLSAMKAVTIDTDEDIFLRSYGSTTIATNNSLYLKGADVTLVATNNLTIRTPGDYGISGGRIFIGKYGDTTQPMVLGRQLAAFLTSLTTNVVQLTTAISTLVTGIKTLGTSGAYVGTATPAGVVTVTPAAATAVATAMDGVTSALGTVTTQLGALVDGANPLGAVFNSTDNYVSKVNL
jgi:hypothetical protein